MGTIRHHAIIVTHYNPTVLRAVHDLAVDLFAPLATSLEKNVVSELSGTVVNGFESFAVFPHGSKMGWDTSDTHENAREVLKSRLRGLAVPFVEVVFDDEAAGPGAPKAHVTDAFPSHIAAPYLDEWG